MNVDGIDLNLLAVFEAMSDERSVTRAAARVGLSQPAMSNALARLRVAFGDPLFVRTSQGMMPTRRAREIAVSVAAALDLIRGTLACSNFDAGRSQAVFRISCTDYVEVIYAIRLARLLETEAPNVQVVIRRSQHIFEVPQSQLETGEIDFALGPYALPLPPRSGLTSIPLGEDNLVGIMRRSRSPNRSAGMTIDEFAAGRHVAIYYDGRGPGAIDRILAQRGHKRNVRIAASDFLTAANYAAKTDAITVVPGRLADELSRILPIHIFALPFDIPTLTFSVVWHLRSNQDPAHVWMRQAITRAAKIDDAPKPGGPALRQAHGSTEGRGTKKSVRGKRGAG